MAEYYEYSPDFNMMSGFQMLGRAIQVLEVNVGMYGDTPLGPQIWELAFLRGRRSEAIGASCVTTISMVFP